MWKSCTINCSSSYTDGNLQLNISGAKKEAYKVNLHITVRNMYANDYRFTFYLIIHLSELIKINMYLGRTGCWWLAVNFCNRNSLPPYLSRIWKVVVEHDFKINCSSFSSWCCRLTVQGFIWLGDTHTGWMADIYCSEGGYHMEGSIFKKKSRKAFHRTCHFANVGNILIRPVDQYFIGPSFRENLSLFAKRARAWAFPGRWNCTPSARCSDDGKHACESCPVPGCTLRWQIKGSSRSIASREVAKER